VWRGSGGRGREGQAGLCTPPILPFTTGIFSFSAKGGRDKKTSLPPYGGEEGGEEEGGRRNLARGGW